MKVAFLGLGTMGAPMAANVLARGHALAVWNRTAARASSLVAAGARLAASPADAARGAELAVLMLADPEAVRAVVSGPDGVLAGLGPGASAIADAPRAGNRAVLVDMSTVDPATARATGELARAVGVEFLDAPVSGSRQPAVDGKLVILAGGEAVTLARVRPVLEAMGRVIAVGGVGQGMAMKLVLNGLGAHMMTGFAALLVLGARQGLPLATMLEVIGAGAFSSPLYASKGARIAARDFSADFSLRLMLKDQELVLATAHALGYAMPSERALRDLLVAAVGDGLGDDDLCGLVRLFESWAGVTAR
jgi:3-hydroxyisobutyrate dehydrogenase-like beta-hydroxyacid dehydrogenase